LGYHRELHFALPKIEYGIRGLALLEDAVVGTVFRSGFPAGDSSEQGFPINRRGVLICDDNLLLFAEGEAGH
jgi:hypothetical protein